MYNIGIDLGGTNIAVGLVNDTKIVRTASAPTDSKRPIEEIIKTMAQLCNDVMKSEGIETINGIGVGAPGVVDNDAGVISKAVNISPNPIELRRLLSQYTDAPIYMENDANCAAIGEAEAGASKGYKSSVMITLGTGVGGGIIIDGKLLKGVKNGGGEIGHTVICADGNVKCKCGRIGCFEQYASATALVNMMNEAAKKDVAWKNHDEFNGKIIFDAAKSGDETALSVINKYIYYLSIGIANFINIFQPEIVVVGGGLSAQGDYLLSPVREIVKDNILTHDASITKIVGAVLGNDAGIIGAALCGNYI